MIEKRTEISPAPIAPKFDKSGPQLGSKEHPPQKENRNPVRNPPMSSQESGNESGLQEHTLPTKTVKDLPNVHDG